MQRARSVRSKCFEQQKHLSIASWTNVPGIVGEAQEPDTKKLQQWHFCILVNVPSNTNVVSGAQLSGFSH